MASDDDDVPCFVLKTAVLGETATGKSSVVRRWVHGIFVEGYKATTGVDLGVVQTRTTAATPAETPMVRLQLYDVSGAERFGSRTESYYRGCSSALLVFDASRPSTLAALNAWISDFRAKAEPRARMVLLANKTDLSCGVSAGEVADFASERGCSAWCVVSARTGAGIRDALDLVVRESLAAARAMGIAVLRHPSPPPRRPSIEKSKSDTGPRLFTNFRS